MRRIYLDANATSPMPSGVRRAMSPWLGCGNPGALHAEGRRAKGAVERARTQVAALVGCQPGEIVFTSGGTESDNAALRGAAAAVEGFGLVLTSPMEHKAVLAPVEALKGSGWGVVTLSAEPRTGRIPAEAVMAGVKAGPKLVSIMLANNEIGTRNDPAVRAFSRAIGRLGASDAVVHTDAVNALGKVPIDVTGLGVDLASFSAHKIGGPMGIGALYVHRDAQGKGRWRPWFQGGGQEEGRRAGTLNVAGAVGFGAAARLAGQRLRRGEPARLRHLSTAFGGVLRQGIPGVQFLGDRAGLPNTVVVRLPTGWDAREAVGMLDRVGVAASAGSACGCKVGGPSHVLKAVQPAEAQCEGVRFSFGWYNDEADAVEGARRTVAVLRQMQALRQKRISDAA